ncbi:hypothetical protein [Legionella sp. WA2022007384]
MVSGKQREYFHDKTNKALRELKGVSTTIDFHVPFFKKPHSIVVPKLDPIDSFDTWLNNVSNIFKTMLYLAEAATFKTLEDHQQISDYFPIHGFLLDALASIIYEIAEWMPKKIDDRDIEMDTIPPKAI